MTLKKFLDWERTSHDSIEVKRVYIDVAGDLAAGILLSQIVYWHLPNKSGNCKLRVKRNGKLWLAKRRQDWWYECRIKEKQVDRCLRKLAEKNIITTSIYKFNGDPTIHISINWKPFLSQLTKAINYEKNNIGNSKLPKGEKRSSSGSKINIPDNSKSYITKSTTKSTSKTTTTGVVVDKNKEYNSETVNVPLPSQNVEQIISLLTPSEPYKFFQASYILNWQINNGYKVKDYESVLVSMLRRGFVQPRKCLSPLKIKELEEEAEKIKSTERELKEKNDSLAAAAESAFDLLSIKKQGFFIDMVKKKYPFVTSHTALRALAIDFFMDSKNEGLEG